MRSLVSCRLLPKKPGYSAVFCRSENGNGNTQKDSYRSARIRSPTCVPCAQNREKPREKRPPYFTSMPHKAGFCGIFHSEE